MHACNCEGFYVIVWVSTVVSVAPGAADAAVYYVPEVLHPWAYFGSKLKYPRVRYTVTISKLKLLKQRKFPYSLGKPFIADFIEEIEAKDSKRWRPA
jgi:hypothetical protein